MNDNRLPLYQRIRDEMLINISSGQWLPDDTIPPESELAKHYNVAVGTVRRAIDTLVQDRILVRRQGSGTYVRRPDFNQSMFRFFRQLDDNGRHLVPDARILSCEEEEACSSVAEALILEENTKVIHLRRLRLQHDRPCFYEDIWLPGMLFQPLLTIPLTSFGKLLYPFYEERCDQRIANAYETLTIENASPELANKLDIEIHQAVVRIERTAYGYNGIPLEYRNSWGDSSTFRYRIAIN